MVWEKSDHLRVYVLGYGDQEIRYEGARLVISSGKVVLVDEQYYTGKDGEPTKLKMSIEKTYKVWPVKDIENPVGRIGC